LLVERSLAGLEQPKEDGLDLGAFSLPRHPRAAEELSEQPLAQARRGGGQRTRLGAGQQAAVRHRQVLAEAGEDGVADRATGRVGELDERALHAILDDEAALSQRTEPSRVLRGGRKAEVVDPEDRRGRLRPARALELVEPRPQVAADRIELERNPRASQRLEHAVAKVGRQEPRPWDLFREDRERGAPARHGLRLRKTSWRILRLQDRRQVEFEDPSDRRW